jgi:hypothetical protein
MPDGTSGAGGGGGGGGGYNIPISASIAQTFSVPQTTNAPSYIIFGAGNRTGGDIEQNPSNINPATATSSAAQGDGSRAASSSEGSGVSGLLPNSGGGLDTKTVLLIGGGLALLLIAGIVAIVVIKKHR